MHTPPPHLVEAVERAAEMRAAAHGWDHVARELDQSISTIRNWPRTYRQFWDQQFANSSRSWSLDLRTEALGFLRTLLRSDDEKVCQNSAKELVSATEKIASTQSHEAAPVSELCRFASQLEKLSDAELTELLDADRRVELKRSNDRTPREPGTCGSD